MAPAGKTRQSLTHHRLFLKTYCSTHRRIQDFITTAIFHPKQQIISISVHSGTQRVLLDFPYSVTDWLWLHTTGSTHTTDLITLPSLKKVVRFVSNPQNDRTLRKPTRSVLNPKSWPQPTPSKATKTHD